MLKYYDKGILYNNAQEQNHARPEHVFGCLSTVSDKLFEYDWGT